MGSPMLRFGRFLAPKIAETCLEIPLGAPKSRSKDLLFGPGGIQGRSKRPPRGLQAARTAPRALKKASGSILEQFGNDVGSHPGAILEQFGDKFDYRTKADDYTDVGR